MVLHTNLRSLAHAVLVDVVKVVHNVQPREGQVMLLDAIVDAMTGERNDLCAEAPTGSGKSFALLSAAFAAAALSKDRTILSTHSLALQDQILDKDAPDVAAATERLTGVRPTFALLKGFSNYGCLDKASAKAKKSVGRIMTIADYSKLLRDTEPTLSWVLDANTNGEKSRCPHPTDQWFHYSIPSDECLKKTPAGCHYSEECHVLRAREQAKDADVVITNHTMLGIQAAKQIAVVMGRPENSPFRHVMIDECHELPSEVRKAAEVTFTVQRFVRATDNVREWSMEAFNDLYRIHPDTAAVAREIYQMMQTGAEAQAALLTKGFQALDPLLDARNKFYVFGPNEEVFDDSTARIIGWVATARDKSQVIIEKLGSLHSKSGAVSGELSRTMARIRTRLSNLYDDLIALQVPTAGTVRWVEQERPAAEEGSGQITEDDATDNSATLMLRYSPVDVDDMCEAGIWTYVFNKGRDPLLDNDKMPTDGERLRMSRIAVSATTDSANAVEMGMEDQVASCPSPFGTALSETMAFIPLASREDDDFDLLVNRWGKFDTERHPLWNAPRMAERVAANGGSALIVSPKARAARFYAFYLREALDVPVFLQEEMGPRRAIEAWKANPGSVLVGVRSLMTGVDAPGDTCTLVEIDRIPRMPPNPLDDARGGHKIYVSDAQRMLRQAAGRLIRKESDRGVVVIADPRMLPQSSSPIGNTASQYAPYREALQMFGRRRVERQDVLDQLAKNRGDRPALTLRPVPDVERIWKRSYYKSDLLRAPAYVRNAGAEAEERRRSTEPATSLRDVLRQMGDERGRSRKPRKPRGESQPFTGWDAFR